TGRARRQRDADRARGRAAEHEQRRRRVGVHVGRQVHAAAEPDRGEAEDEREIGAVQREQALQRLQEHAERIERAEREIERGGRGDRAPCARPDVGAAHDEEYTAARMLPAPGFHHLHLNSVDPEAAIKFYVQQFPRSTKTAWGGLPALAAPNDVLLLFTRVATPPPTSPQTALWHFGWHVTDTRASLQTYESRRDVGLLPLYTTDAGGSVWISSDTWPGTGGVPGRTKAQIGEAIAAGVQPARSGGFGYMRGPDDALVEYAGNHPPERFNHV